MRINKAGIWEAGYESTKNLYKVARGEVQLGGPINQQHLVNVFELQALRVIANRKEDRKIREGLVVSLYLIAITILFISLLLLGDSLTALEEVRFLINAIAGFTGLLGIGIGWVARGLCDEVKPTQEALPNA